MRGKGSRSTGGALLYPSHCREWGGKKQSQQVKTWLQAWCHQWNFGILDEELVHTTAGVCGRYTEHPRNVPVLTWAPPWHGTGWKSACQDSTSVGECHTLGKCLRTGTQELGPPPKDEGGISSPSEGHQHLGHGEQTGGAGTGTAVLGTSGMCRTRTLSSAVTPG